MKKGSLALDLSNLDSRSQSDKPKPQAVLSAFQPNVLTAVVERPRTFEVRPHDDADPRSAFRLHMLLVAVGRIQNAEVKAYGAADRTNSTTGYASGSKNDPTWAQLLK